MYFEKKRRQLFALCLGAVLLLAGCSAETQSPAETKIPAKKPVPTVAPPSEAPEKVQNLTYTMEKSEPNAEFEYYGTLQCTNGDEIVWAYQTRTCVQTELQSISDVYEDAENVYFIADGHLTALNKFTGALLWEVEGVGASNSVVLDDENIYLSGYYGPNLMVVSKNGTLLFEDDDPTFYWVYDLTLDGNILSVHYEMPEEGSPKLFDISTLSFISSQN